MTSSKIVCLGSHQNWKLRYLVPALGDQLAYNERKDLTLSREFHTATQCVYTSGGIDLVTPIPSVPYHLRFGRIRFELDPNLRGYSTQIQQRQEINKRCSRDHIQGSSMLEAPRIRIEALAPSKPS